MTFFFMFVLLASAQAPASAVDATRVTLSSPSIVASLPRGVMSGSPVRLAWSPDGRQIYIGAIQRDRWGNETRQHFMVTLADGKVAPIAREPEWYGAYWAWKSGYNCPGLAALRIETEAKEETKVATNSGAGGSLAQNSGDPYGPGFQNGPQGTTIAAVASQAQKVTTTTLRLKGEVLSEFVNTPAVPGLMYGWAPGSLAAIAYGNQKRVLVIMDRDGHKQEIRGTTGVMLPAWSEDGTRVAWLEQQGRKGFTLTLANLASR